MATKKNATSKKGNLGDLPKSKKKLTSDQAKAVKGGDLTSDQAEAVKGGAKGIGIHKGPLGDQY